MKKAVLAGILAAVTIGALAGGAATFSASQEDAQLQIAGGQQDSESLPEDLSATEEAQKSDGEDAEAQAIAAEQEIAEGMQTLPSGSLQKTDLTDVTDEQIRLSGVAEVAQNVMPAMVSITNTSVQEVMDWFHGGNFQYESKSLGTGVIMGENENELLIVTNNHVVEGASQITVSFIDQASVEGIVKGTDAGNDLAVVAVRLEDITEETMNEIRIANVADSDEVMVGEQVVAIGNALGYGQSVTTGIISALGRTVTVQDSYETVDYEDLIQTDAAINAGNSGGALLNMKGEVIGINSVKAGASGVEGMGYAIPTAKALPIIQELMNRETREKVSEEQQPYLGITGQDVTSDVAQLYGLPEGIYVTEVGMNTPAADAGITAGMIITSFDGIDLKDMADLQSLMEYYAGGETVTITVYVQGDNGYEEQDLELTLGLRSEYIRHTR